jgi:hypothetical protein
MGDHDDRQALPAVQPPHQLHELPVLCGIKPRRGLIEDDAAGVSREDAGERDPLSLATREFERVLLRKRRQVDRLECCGDTIVQILAAVPEIRGAECDLLPNRLCEQLVIRVLEDVPDLSTPLGC